MKTIYPAYEAKAKFGEILRKVRAGQLVVISYRGEEVAEIRAITPKAPTQEKHLRRMEEAGTIVPAKEDLPVFKPLARRPGALRRFLRERD